MSVIWHVVQNVRNQRLETELGLPFSPPYPHPTLSSPNSHPHLPLILPESSFRERKPLSKNWVCLPDSAIYPNGL